MSEEDIDEKQRVTPSLAPSRYRYTFKALILLIVIIALLVGSFLWLSRDSGRAVSPPRGATPTPTPTPTIKATVSPPPQALFYETFQDNHNAWPLSNQGSFLRTIANGKLTLSAIDPNTTLIEGLPNFFPYSNYILTVRFVIEQADLNDSIGVYVRGDNNLDHDYRIDINGNATFDIAKEYLDDRSVPQSIMLDGPEAVPMLHPIGQPNTMTAILQGSNIDVLLNGRQVSSVTDDSYPAGQIALFARHGGSSPAVTVSFSLFEIDRVAAMTTPTP